MKRVQFFSRIGEMAGGFSLLFSNSFTIVNTPETPSKAVKVSRSIPSGYGATADKELAMEFFSYHISRHIQIV